MNFGGRYLKKAFCSFKEEQKWGYAANEHLVMLEETIQETNATPRRCALVGS